jgi:hypothetical protein
MLPGDVQFSAELGMISDRNFLEQYYEREWYEMKDEITGVEFKRIRDNTSWSITADYRLNDFVTQTDWLPRGDHFWLGQSLLWDRLTWYEHTSLGYAQFRALSPPAAAQNPGDKFRFLPWEVNPATGAPVVARGERFVTRQEVDLPFQIGVVKVVPYALGEFGHWGEDLTGQTLDRLYGQVGMRASIPMWRVDPTVQSVLWNLNGLAHKVVFDAEFSYADANRNLTQLPLYEPLDDDDIEAFRRRFVPNTFPAPPGSIPPTPAIPIMFDERFYALRTGMAPTTSWRSASECGTGGRRSAARRARSESSTGSLSTRTSPSFPRRTATTSARPPDFWTTTPGGRWATGWPCCRAGSSISSPRGSGSSALAPSSNGPRKAASTLA